MTTANTEKPWYRQIPFGVYSMLLGICLGITLWASGITSPGAAILSALGLELVIIAHRIYFYVERLNAPAKGILATKSMESATTAANEILDSGSRHGRILVETTASSFCDRVTSLRSGIMTCTPREFMDFADGLFRAATRGDTLRATSHLAGGSYWKQTYGLTYRNLNRVAAENGMDIERIYILRDHAHMAAEQPLLDGQLEFSRVRVIMLDQIDETVEAPERDFFVLSNQVTAEFGFRADMNVSHIDLSLATERVQRLSKEYDRIREHFSQPYPVPSPAPSAPHAAAPATTSETDPPQ